MTPEVIESITKAITGASAIIVLVTNLTKLGMEWLHQKHSIGQAQVQQSHQITTHYLDKALDPAAPLAIRHQLLRFLATPDADGTRLSVWAQGELDRVRGIVDAKNREVEDAERALKEAKNAAEIEQAERRLAEALRSQRGLLEPPTTPPVTAAAIRAGLIEEKKLNGLKMPGANLRDAELVYRELQGADFREADLTEATLQGCDLRAADLSGAVLNGTTFFCADLRGSDLRNAKLTSCNLRQARLEGADLRGAVIVDCTVQATFDESTQWPEGFDAVAAGAVYTGLNEGTAPAA